MSSHFVGRARVAAALAALLLGCGEQEVQQRAYRADYARYLEHVRQDLDSGECVAEASCGELVFVDCRSSADGPAYYVNLVRDQVLEVCGGACLAGEKVNGLCMECPPPEWTCTP